MIGIRLFIFGIGMLAMVRGPHSSPALSSPDVQHTSWKTFYSKIPDTVTLRFDGDSMAVLTSTGVPVLQSTYKLKNDLITFHDYGGMNACRDLTGSYHVRINGDTLALVVDEDPCDGRTGTLISKPWIRVPIMAGVQQ
jgi:hypothetical protein